MNISFTNSKHAHGFYVRAKPNLCTPDITIKYISHYLSRPVIATSRIDNYDGKTVTFHYTRHEDNKTVTETIPALDFINKLIVHIPEKQCFMRSKLATTTSSGGLILALQRAYITTSPNRAVLQALLLTRYNGNLLCKRNLGIRNHGG